MLGLLCGAGVTQMAVPGAYVRLPRVGNYLRCEAYSRTICVSPCKHRVPGSFSIPLQNMLGPIPNTPSKQNEGHIQTLDF